MTAARTVLKDRRYGFDRKIVNEAVGVYRFTICSAHTGAVITDSTAATEEDARRVVRSTTKFLNERGASQ